VRDYDLYVRRNLARGYSAKELNVSFLNEKKFRFQNKMDELKDKGKSLGHGIIQKWEDKSREFITNFLDLFGEGGRINALWNQGKGKIKRALSPSPSSSPSNNGLDEDDYGHDHKRHRSWSPQDGYTPTLTFDDVQYSDESEEEETTQDDQVSEGVNLLSQTHRDGSPLLQETKLNSLPSLSSQ